MGLSRAAATVAVVLIISGAAVAIVVIQSSSNPSGGNEIQSSSNSNGGSEVPSYSPPLPGVKVAVTSQDLVAADFLSTDTATPLKCSVSGAANDLTLTNTGTEAASVTGVTITWAGALNYFSVSGTCIVQPGNPISIHFSATNRLGTNAVAGQTYTGAVELGSGAELLFSGFFK